MAIAEATFPKILFASPGTVFCSRIIEGTF